MNVGDCYDITFYKEKREYRFISEGPKGKITKIVRFKPMQDPDTYNLAFGDLREDDTIDDEIITDNNDRDKVLATVGVIVYKFTDLCPDKSIFFSGSTSARNRLFRMILSIHNRELNEDFNLYGVLENENNLIRIVFQKNENYYGFIIKRNHSSLLYENRKNHSGRH